MSKDKKDLKRVAGNSAWMIIAKVINIVIGLAVSVYVTRYLGAESKGMMANAQAISGFWGFIAACGLADILISKFSKEREVSGKIATSGMIIMLCGGTIAFLLSICSAIVLNTGSKVAVYVAIFASVYLFQFFSVFEYWFYSNSISKYFAIAQSCVHIFFLIVRFIGVPLGAGLLYFVLASVLETVFVFVSMFFCYKKSKCSYVGQMQIDRKMIKSIFIEALPMIAMGFATTIYMKVDQIVVGKMLGNTELGLYSVAVTLAEYWYFIPGVVYSSFLPILAASDKSEYKDKLQKFADIMVLLGYVAAFGVMVFGEWGIGFLYGEEFKKSAYILMVYIWSGIFTCLSYSGQAVYIINKDTKIVMWINIVGAVLNLLLNIVFIQWMGSIGAAFATLLEYMMVAFGQMVVLWKRYSELYIIQLKALIPFKRLFMYAEQYIRNK
ncbi:MAG: flippase [Lachnospiraceae bacterium]|nr:flippase [Lachnospiraceae bacterium]